MGVERSNRRKSFVIKVQLLSCEGEHFDQDAFLPVSIKSCDNRARRICNHIEQKGSCCKPYSRNHTNQHIISITITILIVNKTHSNPCRAYATYVGSTSCPRPSHVEVEGRCLSLCAGSLSRRMLYMHKLSHLSARATLEFHSHTCRWCRRGGGCSPWSTAARTSARQRCSSPYAPRTKPPPHLLRSRHCTAASIGSHPHRRRR